MSHWSIEDIEETNPSADGQLGLLKHLLTTGMTNVRQLSDASERLEVLGSPFVAAFCQLPYRIERPKRGFNAPGTRSTIEVELHCMPTELQLDVYGNLKGVENIEGKRSPTDGLWITHVTAYVRLWDKRARLHEKYIANIGHPAFKDVPLSRIESWMDLPEAQMSLPARRSAMLTGGRFRSEVARRLRYEVLAAVNRLARVYSALTLRQHPEIDRLYGYFGMLTPGEIAGANAPVPIQQFFLRAMLSAEDASTPDPDQVAAMLARASHYPDARNDAMVGQLIAMNSLRLQGEPELSLMGCATALEWFLNERFPDMSRTTRDNRRVSASLSDFAKSKVLGSLDNNRRTRLAQLAHARNRVAHGRPKVRSSTSGSGALLTGSDLDHDARDSLFFALEIYRFVNLAE